MLSILMTIVILLGFTSIILEAVYLKRGKQPIKIPVLLELDLKLKGDGNVLTYRKESNIFTYPFPGLVIDDNDIFKKGNIGITPHQVTVNNVRGQMVSNRTMCYCKTEFFDDKKQLEEQEQLLRKLNWDPAGYPG